jgi:hypothetical protein
MSIGILKLQGLVMKVLISRERERESLVCCQELDKCEEVEMGGCIKLKRV